MSEKDHSVQLELQTSERGKLEPVQTALDGTTQLYVGSKLRLVPAPSDHPNDPLNFPTWVKAMAITSVCSFGSIAIAMQQVMAGLLPVFMLLYAGLDPKLLNQPGGLGAVLAGGAGGFPGMPPAGMPPGGMPPGGMPPGGMPPGGVPPGMPGGGAPPGGMPPGGPPMGGGGNPLEALSHLPGAQPISRVNLLTSLPVLIIGLSNYFLVPASTAFGRRPVMIFCSLLATFSGIWAGYSTSLPSHLAARCLQALGAGAVESLIPLIVQDMTFLHQRSRGMSLIWASQGIITISLGIGSTYIVSRMSWQWLYWILSIITGITALMIILFVPETRWHRDRAALRGETYGADAALDRPAINYAHHGHRTTWDKYGLFNGGIQLKNGRVAFIEMLKTFALPIVTYLILVNAAFIGTSLGSSLTLTTVLLAPPYNWSFDRLGLVVIALFISSTFVMLIGGFASDKLVNWLTLRRGGKREAEYHLWNLILPLFCGVFGCLLFGIGGEYTHKVHWMASLSATAILVFGFLTANIIASVACVESYPQLAGPTLVNVASFRNIIGFGFTYGMPEWVAARGYMGAFGIFAGVLAFLALFLPVFFVYGKQFRRSTRFISKRVEYSL